MARVVVDVMLKPEILDPQGKAVQGALPRLGFDGVHEVRQGKRFELDVDGEVDEGRLAVGKRSDDMGILRAGFQLPILEHWKLRPRHCIG